PPPFTRFPYTTLFRSVSSETGDSIAAVKFPVAKTISSWPFVTGVDVASSHGGAAIVAFGSSLTDGDGSTRDTNRRWPDVLAERLDRKSTRLNSSHQII